MRKRVFNKLEEHFEVVDVLLDERIYVILDAGQVLGTAEILLGGERKICVLHLLFTKESNYYYIYWLSKVYALLIWK